MKTEKNVSALTKKLFEAILPENCHLLSGFRAQTFKAYYYGNVGISRLAKKIYGQANPRLFEIFIRGLNKNQELCDAFSDVIIGITPDNACEFIADYFYTLLYEAMRPARVQKEKNEKILNIKEVAAFFGVKERTIQNWMRRKIIPYAKIGGCCRFRLSDIQKMLKTRKH